MGRCPESGEKKDARKTRMRWKGCVKRDLESGMTTATDLRSWRLVRKDVMREK